MRVSNNQIIGASVQAMQQQGSDVLKYQQQISSGRRFSKASEGAVELGRGVAIQFEKKRAEMLKDNQNTVQSRLDMGYTQLDTMTNLMLNLKDMVNRASFPGFGATDIQALYQEALISLNAFKESANSTDPSGRRYIAVDQPPNVEVEPGVTVPSDVWFVDLNAQITAVETFVDKLSKLNDHYDPESTASEQVDFQNSITGLNTALDRVLLVRTQAGSASAQVDIARSSVEAKGIELDSAHARLLETDIADASTKLIRAQTLLQAVQSIFSRLESSNLFQRLG